MNIESLPEEARPHLARMGPYAARCLERAARFALKLHAECVDLEHLLAALLEDEDCAACQAILHAFADPETIRAEVIALCPGILVIGSKRSLPFSVKAVLAMDATRGIARAEKAASIAPRHLLQAAVDQLSPELSSLLPSLGYDTEAEAPAPELESVPEVGPLLKFFNADARRALSAACRHAVRFERDAISPAHLILGSLEGTPGGLLGLSATRAQMHFASRDEDTTALPARRLPFSGNLLDMLSELPEQASTAPLLAGIVMHACEEVKALLQRQKVTLALLEHTQGVFEDPLPGEV